MACGLSAGRGADVLDIGFCGTEETRIIYAPCLEWNTRAVVEAAGGVPVRSKTGRFHQGDHA